MTSPKKPLTRVRDIKRSLPLRNGVGVSCVWIPDVIDTLPLTLLEFLVGRFPNVSLAGWQDRFEQRAVINSQGVLLAPDQPAPLGQHVYYYRMPYEQAIPFEYSIIAHTEHLLVVDKPHFLPVSPTGKFAEQTVLARLQQDHPHLILAPIHRLDKDTAGVVMFAKSVEAAAVYHSLFTQRQISKTYWAVAPLSDALVFPLERSTHLEKGDLFFTTVENPLKPPNSSTYIELLAQFNKLGLYQVNPLTGRQHQIRVHMAQLGIPILHDRLYPRILPETEDFMCESPMQLLAKELRFVDPFSGQLVSYQSKLKLAEAKYMRLTKDGE